MKGHVGGQPIEPVEDRERYLCGGSPCEAAGCEAPNSVSTSAAGPRAASRGDPKRRSRAAARTADGRSRGRTRPRTRRRGRRARIPAEPAIARASASRRVLPMPALPSMTTNRPPPVRAAPANASSAATWASRSRSSLPPEGNTLAGAIRNSIPQDPQNHRFRDAFGGLAPTRGGFARVQSLRRDDRVDTFPKPPPAYNGLAKHIRDPKEDQTLRDLVGVACPRYRPRCGRVDDVDRLPRWAAKAVGSVAARKVPR